VAGAWMSKDGRGPAHFVLDGRSADAALAYHADCLSRPGESPTLEKALADAAYNRREPFDTAADPCPWHSPSFPDRCTYCGTALVEFDGAIVEDATGRHHPIQNCREYVFAACQSYKKELASALGDAAQLRVRVEQLKAEADRARQPERCACPAGLDDTGFHKGYHRPTCPLAKAGK
jgi:hypothetical protein